MLEKIIFFKIKMQNAKVKMTNKKSKRKTQIIIQILHFEL